MTMSLPSVASGRRGRGRTSGRRGGRTPVAFALMLAFALMCVAATLAAPVAAQDRGPGSAAVESSRPSTCAPPPRIIEPSPEERTQAQELASAARQSVILGDLERARSLLLRAIHLDPTAPNVPYYLARVLDDQGEGGQALAAYCRTLALGAPGDETAFARERIRALTNELQMPDDALAEELRVPDDAFAGELRVPDDAIAPSGSTGPLRTGPLRSRSVRGEANPTTALTLGMLIPGLGQYYSGRPVRGTVVASLAMGALASGLFVQKRSVDCLGPVGSGGGCRPDDIVRVKMSRPYLTTGIAVAGSVALLGALDAYLTARGQGEVRGFTEGRGPHVEGPSISARDGVAELSFLTIRMR